MSASIGAETRASRFAGSFYPGEAEALRKEVLRLLQAGDDHKPGGKILAAAAPHAGYVYSGAIAARVFKALSSIEIDTMVIIGHDFGRQAPGVIAVLPDYHCYRTPLGEVAVDETLRERLLRDEPRLIRNNQVHAAEHSIEVQLPFLQITHPQAKILPVLFGEVTPEHCRAFVAALRKNLGSRRLLILASTDLAHYPNRRLAPELNRKTLSFAENYDLAGLCRWQAGGEWENLPGVETPICSAGGLGVALHWARTQGGNRVEILQRGNSGDCPGADDRRVVGYAALLFVNSEEAKATTDSAAAEPVADKADFKLSAAAQKYLLGLARQRVAAGVHRQSWQLPVPDLEEVKAPGALFVTLHQKQQLRGCIGTTRAEYPLYQAVSELAYAAAFQDSRFPPLAASELAALNIEISVLSPLTLVSSASAIVPGKHGVVVRRGGRSGLFLPQVWEQLPEKEEFLNYLCAEKAGLPATAWRESGTQLYIFTVFAFTE